MRILEAFFLTVFVAGCGATPDTSGPAEGAERPDDATTEIGSTSAGYAYAATSLDMEFSFAENESAIADNRDVIASVAASSARASASAA